MRRNVRIRVRVRHVHLVGDQASRKQIAASLHVVGRGGRLRRAGGATRRSGEAQSGKLEREQWIWRLVKICICKVVAPKHDVEWELSGHSARPRT